MDATWSKEFFAEVFSLDVQSYRIAIERVLLQTVQGQAVVATAELNLQQFEHSRGCTLQLQPIPRPTVDRNWGGEDLDQIQHRVLNGLWNVTWNDHSLQVLKAEWDTSCGSVQCYWIIADSETVAEDFMLAVARHTNHPGEAMLVFGEGRWQRSTQLYEAVQKSSFDDLVLDGTLKASMRSDFAQFLAARDRYRDLGVSWRRGALLVGPPGNGKTHCVRALVRELGVPALYVRSLKHRFFEREDLLKMVFDRARELRPCVLILEDLDSLIDESNQSFFLNQLDGFEKNEGLIVLATTNHPARIDPAIVDRPSRFDRKYHFPLPNRTHRREFLNCWRHKLEGRVDWPLESIESIADFTDGFSFAYLKELVISGLLNWIAHPQRPLAEHVSTQGTLLRSQMQTTPIVEPAE